MPPTDPADPADLDVVRRSQDRALEREGIPMYLALVREGGDAPPFPETTEPVRAAGEALAARLDDRRARLAPSQHDRDLGVLITLLAATAYDDFDHSALR